MNTYDRIFNIDVYMKDLIKIHEDSSDMGYRAFEKNFMAFSQEIFIQLYI